GSSLIGVSIDYVVHVYCFSALHQGDAAEGRIFPSLGRTLATGAATTIAGFLALVPSSLVGLREVACFSVAGMLAAYMATRFMLPSLIPSVFPPVALRRRVVDVLERIIARLRARRSMLFVFPLGAAVFVALVLPHARWNEDFASLNRL